MKNPIRPPIEAGKNKHRIPNPRERSHWWWLNIPTSLNRGKSAEMTSNYSFLPCFPLGKVIA